jgi:predicted nucleic acid-binding protein
MLTVDELLQEVERLPRADKWLLFRRMTALLEREAQAADTCIVVKFELRFGALRSQSVEKNLEQQAAFLNRFVSLPFDDAVEIIRADLAQTGTPIGPYDILIAATALAHDLILVTHNTREFGRVTGFENRRLGS